MNYSSLAGWTHQNRADTELLAKIGFANDASERRGCIPSEDWVDDCLIANRAQFESAGGCQNNVFFTLFIKCVILNLPQSSMEKAIKYLLGILL